MKNNPKHPKPKGSFICCALKICITGVSYPISQIFLSKSEHMLIGIEHYIASITLKTCIALRPCLKWMSNWQDGTRNTTPMNLQQCVVHINSATHKGKSGE